MRPADFFARGRRVCVVSTVAEADAVLSVSLQLGSKNVDWPYVELGNPTPRFGARVIATQELLFHLDMGPGQAVWGVKYDADDFAGRGDTEAARAIARRLSRDFLKALDKDSKRPQ